MTSKKYDIPFISEHDFEAHVAQTVEEYAETLKGMDLARFNANIVDPVKLTFDSALFRKNAKEIIELEIQRQRDKSNSNSIGYFHQNIFRYVAGCVVPAHGFDVIFTEQSGKKIYVEVKNKHNTMNSSSAQKTYIKMQSQIAKCSQCECWLVEVISKRSRNDVWTLTVDGESVSNDRIRRVSIDNFYAKITGISDAFMRICRQLPVTIDKLVKNKKIKTIEKDSVFDELSSKNPDLLKSLYLLAFESYIGFKNL